jgi:hypothetical protein
MEPPRSLDALAALIAVNVTPLAGILLLGWLPAAVLISYFIDTFLGLGAVVLLVMIHVTGDEHNRPISGWRNWAKAVMGLGIIGMILAVPLSFPLWFTLSDDRATWELLSDRGFLAAIGVQCAMSTLAVARMHRELKARSDDDRVLARRMLFLTARWMALFVAMVTGLVSLLGPMVGGFILVAMYAAGSVYFELYPERAERLLRGNDAKPMTFGEDLESRIAAAAPDAGSPSRQQAKDTEPRGGASESRRASRSQSR